MEEPQGTGSQPGVGPRIPPRACGRNRLRSAGSILLVAACFDDPLSVTSPTDVGPLADDPPATTARSASPEMVGPIIDEFRHRLELDFAVVGEISLSGSIVVRLNAVAVEAVTGGEVFVTLPTQDGLTYVGVGDRRTFAQNRVPSVASWQLPVMSAGKRWTKLVTVGIVEKGYYDVVVGIRTRGPETDRGPFLVDHATREAWVFVDENGGRLTSVFDPSLFPERISPVAGPFRVRPKYAPPGSASTDGWESGDSDDDPVYVELVYLDSTNVVRAAVGAYASGNKLTYGSDDEGSSGSEACAVSGPWQASSPAGSGLAY